MPIELLTMRILAISVLVAALAAGGGAARALRVPAAPTLPVFPASNAWNQRVDTLPVAANSAAIIALDRRSTGTARRLRLRPLGRRADRDPVRRRRARRTPKRASASTTPTSPTTARTRSRERPRSRAAASDGDRHALHRRPRHLPALRAVRAAPAGRRLDGRLGRDLEPALERAAARGLDVGRRRRAADLPRASRATTRSQRGAIDHALRFTVQRTRTRLRLPRAPLRERARPTRPCRRWACACG